VSDRRRTGEYVTEHIRLLRELGHGAMGSVWVADHLTLDTQVAVKFINKHLLDGDSDDVCERFAREAKAAAHIKSPHVVQIFDHGMMGGATPYIVMELLEGESLADRLERTGWLSLEQCAQVVGQMASALAKAHKLGIVHRDIKPENVFLCPSDDGLFVKLLDFGIAKHSGSPKKSGATLPGMVIGTAEYMSREQVVSSADVDHQADLWALAVVAYEVLAGDVPFTGETVGGIWASIVRGRFLPPSTLRKECSQRADGLFTRAFAFDKAERFPSARELAAAYREALDVDVRVSEPTPYELRRTTSTEVGLGRNRQNAVTLDDAIVRRVEPPHEPISDGESQDEEPIVNEQPPRKWFAIASAAVLGVGFAVVLTASSSKAPVAPPATTAQEPQPAATTEPAAAPERPVREAPPIVPSAKPEAPPPRRREQTESKENDKDPERTDYGF